MASGWKGWVAVFFGLAVLWGCGPAAPPTDRAASAEVRESPAAEAVREADDEAAPAEADPDDGGAFLNSLVTDSVRRIMGRMQRTRYTNTGYRTEGGFMAVDCSSYVRRVLEALPGEHYGVLPKSGAGGRTALAKDYYACFSAQPATPDAARPWMRVEHVRDVRPGDVIAYEYTDDEDRTTTGHVMIAWSRAVRSRCGDTDQYWVYISDAARSGHRADTRNGQGPYARLFRYEASTGADGEPSGIGIGKMWFHSGPGPYYRWKSCSGPKHGNIRIAIGRPVRLKAP